MAIETEISMRIFLRLFENPIFKEALILSWRKITVGIPKEITNENIALLGLNKDSESKLMNRNTNSFLDFKRESDFWDFMILIKQYVASVVNNNE